MADLTSTDRAIRASRRQPIFTTSADRGWVQRFQLAGTDLREGINLWRLAWVLGVSDIRLRYRGSTLGPFWLTLSTAVMIGSMGFLYAALFHIDTRSYIPFLTVSLVFWNFLGALVTEGCTCFTIAEPLIKGTRMPFSVHAFRSLVRNGIVLGHNIIVIIGVFLIFHVGITVYALAVIPAFALWLINGLAITLLLGALCARFRDVPQIVASLLQIAFFLTPVMWNAAILSGRHHAFLLIQYNPFYYFLEILRAPLLGTPMDVMLWPKSLLCTGVIIGLAAVFFAKTRGRISYWV
jgi:lipopolysaccharide transport system permease protein